MTSYRYCHFQLWKFHPLPASHRKIHVPPDMFLTHMWFILCVCPPKHFLPPSSTHKIDTDTKKRNYLWDTISIGSQLLLLLLLLLLSGASNWCCNMATTSATCPWSPWPPSALPQSQNVWHNLCRLQCCCCILGLLHLLLLLQSHSFNKSVRVQDAGEFNEPTKRMNATACFCVKNKKAAPTNKNGEKKN